MPPISHEMPSRGGEEDSAPAVSATCVRRALSADGMGSSTELAMSGGPGYYLKASAWLPWSPAARFPLQSAGTGFDP